MKEQLKIHNENMLPALGRDGNAAKHPGRQPLSNKTNKVVKKCQLSHKAEDKHGLKIHKTGKKSVFTVFEDGSAESEQPEQRVTVSSRQTQTDQQLTQTDQQQTQTDQQPSSSDADRLLADMCAEEPSAQYWRQLAETRRGALEETLQENKQLHERLAAAEEELRLMKEVVQRAEDVMAAVNEWSEENEQKTEESH